MKSILLWLNLTIILLSYESKAKKQNPNALSPHISLEEQKKLISKKNLPSFNYFRKKLKMKLPKEVLRSLSFSRFIKKEPRQVRKILRNHFFGQISMIKNYLDDPFIKDNKRKLRLRSLFEKLTYQDYYNQNISYPNIIFDINDKTTLLSQTKEHQSFLKKLLATDYLKINLKEEIPFYSYYAKNIHPFFFLNSIDISPKSINAEKVQSYLGLAKREINLSQSLENKFRELINPIKEKGIKINSSPFKRASLLLIDKNFHEKGCLSQENFSFCFEGNLSQKILSTDQNEKSFSSYKENSFPLQLIDQNKEYFIKHLFLRSKRNIVINLSKLSNSFFIEDLILKRQKMPEVKISLILNTPPSTKRESFSLRTLLFHGVEIKILNNKSLSYQDYLIVDNRALMTNPQNKNLSFVFYTPEVFKEAHSQFHNSLKSSLNDSHLKILPLNQKETLLKNLRSNLIRSSGFKKLFQE